MKLGILFDLDGTLVNSLGDICGNLNKTREWFGFPSVPENDLRRWIGKGVDHLVRNGVPELPPERMDAFIAKYREIYGETPHISGHLYPGVEETLARLRAMPWVKLGVCTNKSTRMAERTLEYYLPRLSFDVVAGADSVSEKKPSPRHLLDVLPGLGIEARQAWFIGDDPVDAASAEGAGVAFLAAAYGFGGVIAPPHQQLSAFPQLLEKIPRLFAN